MIGCWHWSASDSRFSWSLRAADGSADDVRSVDVLRAPRLDLDGEDVSFVELLSRSNPAGGLQATIKDWNGAPELQGCRLSGFRRGDVASGVIEALSAGADRPDFDLAATLMEGIEALPEAFVLYDENDRMVVCNEQYRRLYPLVADMMQPGMRFRDVVAASVERGVFQIDEDVATWAERRISFHQAGIGFFEQHLADGRWIQVSERQTASGGTTSIRADITVLKERERDLRLARSKAESETAARTAFIARLGHELRNPLNVVLGIAQILAVEPLPERHQALVEGLTGASRAMRDVLNDVLDIARVRTGETDIRIETVATKPFAREMTAIASAMAQQKGLDARCDVAETTPGWIETDPRRLRQILFNLLGNAVKYTEEGVIDLSWSRDRDAAGQDRLLIVITDSGSGIAPDLGSRLFAPYTRQREHVLAGVEGLGLGLSISEELATALGADLGIEPGHAGGTRAWISLPVGHPAVRAQTAPKSGYASARWWVGHPAVRAQTAPPASEGLRPLRAPLNVLVIDDEPTNLLVAEALLRRLGHAVTTVSNGPEGLSVLSTHRFDVAFLDIAMPQVSGIEIARCIRERGLDIELIAMTGNVMPADIKSYLSAGFTGFVEKPVELEELAAALDRAGQVQDTLRPTERMRFPRAETARTFDRTLLDRMVADIGRGSVASIVATGMATFRQTLTALSDSADCELDALMHKVRSVAGLFGLDDLARTVRPEGRTVASLTGPERASLAVELEKAVAQLERYMLDLEPTVPG